MNTICTRCGSPDVSCEAMINPNTNELRNYTDEAFLYGWCETCGFGSILTDTDEVKSEIEKYFRQFMELHVEEPDYAVCDIVWKDSNKIETVKIGDCPRSAVPMGMVTFSSGAAPFRNCCPYANTARKASLSRKYTPLSFLNDMTYRQTEP